MPDIAQHASHALIVQSPQQYYYYLLLTKEENQGQRVCQDCQGSDSVPTLGTTNLLFFQGLKCCQSSFSLCDSVSLGLFHSLQSALPMRSEIWLAPLGLPPSLLPSAPPPISTKNILEKGCY